MNLPYPVVNLFRIEGNSFIKLVVKITDFLKSSSYWTGHAQWQQNTNTSDLLQLYVNCKHKHFLYQIINFLFIQQRKVKFAYF